MRKQCVEPVSMNIIFGNEILAAEQEVAILETEKTDAFFGWNAFIAGGGGELPEIPSVKSLYTAAAADPGKSISIFGDMRNLAF